MQIDEDVQKVLNSLNEGQDAADYTDLLDDFDFHPNLRPIALCKLKDTYLLLGYIKHQTTVEGERLFIGKTPQEVTKCDKTLLDLSNEELISLFTNAVLSNDFYYPVQRFIRKRISSLKQERNNLAKQNKLIGFNAGQLDKRKTNDNEIDELDANTTKIAKIEEQIEKLRKTNDSIKTFDNAYQQLKLF